jgi:hypothetical protein
MTCSPLPDCGATGALSTPELSRKAARRPLQLPDTALRPQPRRRHALGRQAGVAMADEPGMPLLLVAVLCVLALLVAPERPQDQEAICQRHKGVEACRVW